MQPCGRALPPPGAAVPEGTRHLPMPTGRAGAGRGSPCCHPRVGRGQVGPPRLLLVGWWGAELVEAAMAAVAGSLALAAPRVAGRAEGGFSTQADAGTVPVSAGEGALLPRAWCAGLGGAPGPGLAAVWAACAQSRGSWNQPRLQQRTGHSWTGGHAPGNGKTNSLL